MRKIQLLLALVLAVPASAYAGLEVYKIPGPDLSNTIQAQTFVLQLGDSPTESGCVTWNGSADVKGALACVGNPVTPPTYTGESTKPASQTRTIGALQIADGNDLRIMFDSNQSGVSTLISLDALRLLLLNPTTGAVIFQAELNVPCAAVGGVQGLPGNLTNPCVFDPTLTGNGKNDALLRLDTVAAHAYDVAVAAAVASGVVKANIHIGLLANLSGPTSGGFEGFYVGNIKTLDNPEPGTLAIVALGLACTMFVRRRRAVKAR